MSKLTTSIQLARIKARMMEIAESITEDATYNIEDAAFDILTQVSELKEIEDVIYEGEVTHEHNELLKKIEE
ncbi:hypothetical protein SAMN04489762_1073 [Terribacillus saccharophilus]|uniref:Phage protein n=1 Tax=Terribacillus saccharophilus TaxID=361277 RepID=A0AAX2EDF8_9BACI|nr:hypothetical protein SAMN04489762_1073 [Terribacillus saccharophilus]